MLEATTEAVPTPRAGRATAAPTGPEAATAATAELAAAATRAAPKIDLEKNVLGIQAYDINFEISL